MKKQIERWSKGSALSEHDKKHVLCAYVHRYTREHIPEWVQGTMYKIQFDSDVDWLNNTEFQVNKDGTLYLRATGCLSHPTWPDNPELMG